MGGGGSNIHDGGTIAICAGASTSADGGDIFLAGGRGLQTGGNIQLQTGSGLSRSGNLSLSTAGLVYSDAPSDTSDSATGSIHVTTGQALSGESGSISLATGHASCGAAGAIELNVGSGVSGGGHLNVTAGDNTGCGTQGGSIRFSGGDGSAGGNVTVCGGAGATSYGGSVYLMSGAGMETSGNMSLGTGLLQCLHTFPISRWAGREIIRDQMRV